MDILKVNSLEEYNRIWNRDRSYLSTAHLKWIAVFTMVLSHLAQTNLMYNMGEEYWFMADIFVFIGRIAMPIFCFFTVQAIIYTKNYKKYFFRLLAFALVAEVPYDLAFYEKPFYSYGQNVIFTILIAAFAIFLIDKLLKRDENIIINIVGIILITIAAMYLAVLLRTDYSSMGVVAIVLIYLARNNKILSALALMIGFLFEFEVWGSVIPISYGFVYLAIPLIMLYNGKRGNQNKWAFYIFYPAHLLVIYLMKLLIL